jgi:hypothetical protein
MATRSGSVDPGLVLWLQTHAKIGAGELSDALEHRSGLLGLAGGTGRSGRPMLRSAAWSSPRARTSRSPGRYERSCVRDRLRMEGRRIEALHHPEMPTLGDFE